MTTNPDPLTGKLVAQETTLDCGCVIGMVRTIVSFKDALERDLLDDFHPELTFCPLHEAAGKLLWTCKMVVFNAPSSMMVLVKLAQDVIDMIPPPGEPHERNC